MRQLLSAAFGLCLLFGFAPTVHADEAPTVPEIIATAAETWGVDSGSMLRVAQCESAFRPDAVGDHGGSLGIFQLRSPGMRDVFLAWQYTDAFDPDQSADFTARWIALTGNWQPWTCARKLGVR